MYRTEHTRILILPNVQVLRTVLGMKEALRSMLRMKDVEIHAENKISLEIRA